MRIERCRFTWPLRLAMGFAIERLMNSMVFNAGGVDIAAYLMVVPAVFLLTMLAAYVLREGHPELPRHRRCDTSSTQRRIKPLQHVGGSHPDKSVAIHLSGLHLVQWL